MDSRRARRAARFALPTGGAAAALAAALLAAPPVATSSSTAGCRVPRSLAGFHGHFSMSFSKSATGTTPGEGGTETISLSRSATLQVRLSLKKTSSIPGVATVLVAGKVTGGAVTVADSLSHSDGTSSGHVSASAGPVGSGLVALFPRVCSYQLLVGFNQKTTFSGDTGIQPRFIVASGSAYTPRRKIPGSLKLSGSATVSAYYTGCLGQTIPDEQGCYQFDGGFAVDFETLLLCGSVVGAKCAPEDEPQGDTQISWSLSPTYKK